MVAPVPVIREGAGEKLLKDVGISERDLNGKTN